MDILPCFKAYDIRGKVPSELNEDVAYKLGLAFVKMYSAKEIVVGFDIRHSSQTLFKALTDGIMSAGANVINIGLCGTEEVYFQTVEHKACGGIMITASHNPKDYNGLKLVREQAIPISSETGLVELSHAIVNGNYAVAAQKGNIREAFDKTKYIQKLLGFIDILSLKPLKIMVNSGNGCASPILDLLESHLPLKFEKVFHEPNGDFPNGIPNQLLHDCRKDSSDAVLASKADFGIAWDGDFDRCFFFDEKGRFIEGYYIVGLLAEQLLAKNPKDRIIIDPRMTWNSLDIIEKAQSTCIMSKSGHTFIKEKMRETNSLYGGEMSAHHYFRDFFYCDSGMVPWLLIAELISKSAKPLSSFVDERIAAFPCSGEINFKVSDSKVAIANVLAHFAGQKYEQDSLDGLSLNFGTWRFNLRTSNTEPLIRLNIETKADQKLLAEKIELLTKLIQG